MNKKPELYAVGTKAVNKLDIQINITTERDAVHETFFISQIFYQILEHNNYEIFTEPYIIHTVHL
jgi:hypothetical protein